MIGWRGSGLFRRRVSASAARRRPDFATVAVLACCPFLGAGAVLVLDPPGAPPSAVTAQVPTAPTDAPVPPLLAPEPAVETTATSTPEQSTATVRTAPPVTPSRTAEPAPAAPPTSTPPQPSTTPTPEPEPERPTWTQADQDAADARCEASHPGSRAENTPDIGDTYDPDVHYPCAGESRRSSLLPNL